MTRYLNGYLASIPRQDYVMLSNCFFYLQCFIKGFINNFYFMTSTNIAVTLRRFFSNEKKLIKQLLEPINDRLF